MTHPLATATDTLPRGWPPEQPTVEVGTLLHLARWCAVGVGSCLCLLAAILALLAIDRHEAAQTRARIVELLAVERR